MIAEENNTETLLLGRSEALTYIRKAKNKPRFGVHVKIWLPTSPESGFESGAFVFVTRKNALSIVAQGYSDTFERRGGKIQLEVQLYRNVTYITIGGVPVNQTDQAF